MSGFFLLSIEESQLDRQLKKIPLLSAHFS